MQEFISAEEQKNFQILIEYLKRIKIPVEFNNFLVRGLDYYSNTIFEWIDKKDKDKNTICAGGRYNNLMEVLGGIKTSAVGCAIGIERVISLVDELKVENKKKDIPDIYVISNYFSVLKTMRSIENIKYTFPKLTIIQNIEPQDIRLQIKKAKKIWF
jgi:histidyl-tRNA synthetase